MTYPRFPMLLALPVLALVAVRAPAAAPRAAPEIQWKKTVVDPLFRAEGAAAADVNRDGKTDILAGNLWYEAPGWTPHEIRPAQAFDGKNGYSNCFQTFAYDVDGDRWTDQIVIGFPGKKASWFRNPAGGDAWEEHTVTESACNETPALTDLDGDGAPEFLAGFKSTHMAFYKPGP